MVVVVVVMVVVVVVMMLLLLVVVVVVVVEACMVCVWISRGRELEIVTHVCSAGSGNDVPWPRTRNKMT